MTNDMTRGNPTRLIISFTLPVLFGNLCQQLYGMVDSIIVGRAISMEALAAVGATSGISFLVIGCIQGLTAGFSVITAQRFGAGDYEGVKRSVATSALLSLAATVLLTAAGILTARPLLEVMNTPADIIEDSYAYIIVIYYGVAATAFYNLLSCIIRALGDSKTPLIFLVFASFLNVALDLLFIITFHMGVGGAAWATVLSQGVSGLLCLGYAWRRFPLLRMEKRHWTFDWSYAWKHLRLALPMAMQFVITGTSVLVNQAVLNLFGSAAVAAFSAASKIHMLSEQVAVSFGTAMATYAGQNYGAGKAGRVREGLRKCTLLRGNYTGNYGDHDRVWRGDVLLVHRRVSSGGDSAGASLPVYFRPVLSRANDAVPLSEYPFGTGKRRYPDAGGSLRAAVENDRRACSGIFFRLHRALLDQSHRLGHCLRAFIPLLP